MKELPLLTLDFETYYESTKYTLKALTYAEYVHHEKFKIHGCGIIFRGERMWITDMDELRNVLDTLGEDVRLLCHNTMFDGYILHAIFNWHPKVYLDTQGMSRGMFVGQSASLDALCKRLFPDDKSMRKGKELVNTINKYDLTPEELTELGGYCVHNKGSDCALTLACYEVMEPHFPDRELELIDLTLQKFCDPIFELDIPLTEKVLRVKTKLRDRAIKRAKVPESVLSSNPKFQAWIEKQGIEPPMKVSPDTGEETLAGGKSDLEFQLVRKSHPELEHVWAGRIATKSTGEISRAKRFLQVAELNNGKLPAALSYYGAHTGRYGGTQKTNLQNLGRGSQLRRAIRAPKGQLVYVADSSNIEARMNNWNAGQTDMVEIFRSGADVYSLFAEENIYHFPIDKHRNKTERFVGKVAVLGLGYGMGAPKFRTTLASGSMGMEVIIEADDAYGVVRAYRVRHNKIVDYWNAGDLALAKMLDPQCDEEWGVLHLMHNMIVLPNGMALQYPGLHAEEDKNGNLCFQYHNGKFWKNTWGGTITENIIQALARIVLFEQMLDINAWTKQFDPKGRVCLNVHDEIITVASDFGAIKTNEWDPVKKEYRWKNDSEAREYYAGIEKILRTPLDWCPDLPLDCEGGWDYCYSK